MSYYLPVPIAELLFCKRLLGAVQCVVKSSSQAQLGVISVAIALWETYWQQGQEDSRHVTQSSHIWESS